MGSQDRDYMHERRRSPLTPPKNRGGLFVASIFLTLAVLLYMGYGWLLTKPITRGLLPAPDNLSTLPARVVSSRAPCDGLAQQIEHLDATARQPQLTRTQDRIRVERGRVRDLQTALHC